jgi:predicted GH43/DUF377 family glycosyl hydrolase
MKVKKNQKSKSKAFHNPLGVTTDKGNIVLFFKTKQLGRVGLYLARGKTGISFASKKVKVSIKSADGKKINIDQHESISISPCDRGYFMTFVQKDKKKSVLMGAISTDLITFNVIGKISKAQDKGVLVPNYKCDGNYVMFLGKGSIHTAVSKDLKKWKISDVSSLTPRSIYFDSMPLSVLSVSLTSHGVLVVYDASFKKNGKQTLQIGGALFSLSDSNNLIWRSESPLWQQELAPGSEEVSSVGAAFYKEKIFLYFASKVKELMAIAIAQPFPSIAGKKVFVNLKRFYKNPIIIPNSINEWESEGTFNPAALYDDGKVHLLYRAVGRNGISCFGYASTKDGFHIEESLSEPAYMPRRSFEGVSTAPSQCTDLYKSGCGWGGCEDPKLTAMGDTIYLTYVAYSGYSHPRAALSSIKRSDFLAKKWKWTEPVLMSRPGEVNKSACILPEKVKGQYVIFHRVFPHILIDYRDELSFGDGKWLQTKARIPTRPNMWDSRKLSVGATPIRTEDGWLVIYHAVDDRDDTRYKIGAMILDINDPSKVLFRTSNPILEPDEHYENEGKPGVVYPCGAVVLGKELFVYYGGGDRVVCCATAQLDNFINEVKKDKPASYTFKEISFSQ